MSGANRQSGMTLIELMVAMAIFGVLSLLIYSSMNNILTGKAHTDRQAERLNQLQQTFTIIQRDMEQIISRPVRDDFGDEQPALKASSFGDNLLELTRAGLTNPIGLPRSQLQRVAYRVEDDVLIRQFWTALDLPGAAEPVERQLIGGLESVEIRYLDKGNEWRNDWPPGTGIIDMPLVIELKMELAGFGEIKRLFRVPPGDAGLIQTPASP